MGCNGKVLHTLRRRRAGPIAILLKRYMSKPWKLFLFGATFWGDFFFGRLFFGRLFWGYFLGRLFGATFCLGLNSPLSTTFPIGGSAQWRASWLLPFPALSLLIINKAVVKTQVSEAVWKSRGPLIEALIVTHFYRDTMTKHNQMVCKVQLFSLCCSILWSG